MRSSGLSSNPKAGEARFVLWEKAGTDETFPISRKKQGQEKAGTDGKSRDRRNVSYFSIPHKREVILRVQRVESILNLLINFRLLNSALQDDRSIRRNEMRQLPRLRSGFRHAARTPRKRLNF